MISFKTKLKKISKNSGFVDTSHLLERQTPACYVNPIPLKRVGKKFEMAHLHCQKTQHSYFPLTIKLFFKHTNLETSSLSTSSPLRQCNDAAVKQTEQYIHGVIEHRDYHFDWPRQTARQHIAALARRGGTTLLRGANIFKEGSFT